MTRQTSCRHCGQDIENESPFRTGEWRDRGNNIRCPTPDGEPRRFHRPVFEGADRRRQRRPTLMVQEAPLAYAHGNTANLSLADLIGQAFGVLVGERVRKAMVTAPDLLLSDAHELAYRAGITYPQAVRVAAAVELGRRAVSAAVARTQSASLRSPGDLSAYLTPLLTGRAVEQFGVVALSTKHAPLATSLLTAGTMDRTLVDPNDVLRFLIYHRAAAGIVFHNHPSGDPVPSEDDIRLEAEIRRRLEPFALSLVDFLILGGREGTSGYFSFAAAGRLGR